MVKFENEIYAYVLENALLYEKAIESAVLPKLFQHGLEKQDINVVMPRIKEIVKEVNSFSEEKRNSMFEKYKEYIKPNSPICSGQAEEQKRLL